MHPAHRISASVAYGEWVCGMEINIWDPQIATSPSMTSRLQIFIGQSRWHRKIVAAPPTTQLKEDTLESKKRCIDFFLTTHALTTMWIAQEMTEEQSLWKCCRAYCNYGRFRFVNRRVQIIAIIYFASLCIKCTDTTCSWSETRWRALFQNRNRFVLSSNMCFNFGSRKILAVANNFGINGNQWIHLSMRYPIFWCLLTVSCCCWGMWKFLYEYIRVLKDVLILFLAEVWRNV